MKQLENCIAKRCGCPVFPSYYLPECHLPYNEKEKELCRSVTLSTGINYVKFHDSTIRHVSVQGINIIVLKKAGSENWRYDAENGNQSQRVIHNFFRKIKQIKFIKNFLCK